MLYFILFEDPSFKIYIVSLGTVLINNRNRMKVSVYSFYCDDQDTVNKVEQSAKNNTDVLIISKGDKVVKVCSTNAFHFDEGLN